MANRDFTQFFRTLHKYPVLLDCSFTVDADDAGGLGITGLKGPGVANVFMHTSATPGVGNNGVTNPNPAAGTILVQLQDNYNKFFTSTFSIESPLGTPVKVDASDANLTAGVAYTITTVGSATAADWAALGLPAGITPAVGVSFVAIATGAGTSSTTYVAPTAAAGSNIFSLEIVGDPNTTIAPNRLTQSTGSQIILQCRNDSSSDAPAIATPADGTVISLALLLSNSSVVIAGE